MQRYNFFQYVVSNGMLLPTFFSNLLVESDIFAIFARKSKNINNKIMANQHVLSSIFSIALLFLAGGHADATSWRINNNANRKAHFKDINAAMSSSEVQAGDTLYLDPECSLTTAQNVSKRVTIIGTGYFLPDGTHQVATVNGRVTISAEGTKLIGLYITKTNDSRITIKANNVVVERCHLWDVFWGGTGQHATIRQCYLTGRVVGSGINSANSLGSVIENNIIYYSYTGASYSAISDLKDVTIRNNYVRCMTSNTTNLINNIANSTIINNIFIQPKDKNKIRGTLEDCIFAYNVMSCEEGNYELFPDNLSTGTNDETVIFALEGSNDQLYQLKEDSPAKGYANDGGDCGPYGGTHPYIPSGYPLGMPRFVSNSAGTRATDSKVSFSNQVSIQER